MIRVLAIVAAVAVAGCHTVPTMQPLVAGPPNDAAQWASDLEFCRAVALAANKPLSVGTITTKGSEGFASNLPGAVAQWYVPVLGAAGNATSETLDEIGITDVYQQRVFIKCLDRKTEWDRSALEVEPSP